MVVLYVLCAVLPGLLLFNHVFASAPYAASDVLGQHDANGQPSFTNDFIDGLGLPDSGGFESPVDIKIDAVHHELYALEGANANRVQVYNLDNSNQLIDRVPDYVLGQTDFPNYSAATAQNRLNVPLGMDLDVPGQRLFVADTFNNRVLVFDTSSLSNGENASVVLGQANFTSSTAATTQTGMHTPTGIAYDATDQLLFVGDVGNARVLAFDTSALSNGQAAMYVLGQANYTTGSCGVTSASSLCDAEGLAYDTTNQRLFATDSNRVLVFSTAAISSNMSAVHVLGQALFTTNTGSASQAGLLTTRRVLYDSTNDRIFVSCVKRIIIYDTSSISDGENAASVIGQADFTSQVAGTTQGVLDPYGMSLDPTTMRLYVADWPGSRYMIFDVSSIANGENAVDEMGQTDINGAVRWTTSYPDNEYVNAKGLDFAEGMTIDTVGHRLFVSDTFNGRVLIYNLDASDNLIDHTADAVLGAPDFSTSSSTATQSTMAGPVGLAYDSARKWLFVSDDGNHRILIFDVATVTNGENALYVLGQPNFTSIANGLSDSQFGGEMTGLAYDAAHQLLFADDMINKRVLVFDVSSPSNGMAATYVLGQSDLSTNTFIDDQSSFDWPESVTYDPLHSRLYVGDTWDARVMVFDLSSGITDGMPASYVLGQPDFATYNAADPTASSVSMAQGVYFDPSTQYLWTTDWDGRVMAFDTTHLSSGMDASFVIGQPDFTTSNFDVTQTAMNDTYGVYVDPTNQRVYVADDYDNRIMIFDAVHITTASLSDATQNQSYAANVATAGSQGTVTLAVTSGSLPAGLSMDSSGHISGTPAVAGTYSFTITASDDNGAVGVMKHARDLSITVDTPPSAPSLPTSSPDTSKTTTAAAPTEATAPTETVLLNDDANYTNDAGSTQTMSTGSAVTFTLANTSDPNEVHTATVNTVTDSYVDLTVASDPIHLRLYIGDTQAVDVDRNGVDDISVQLLGITNGKADLVFKSLASSATQPDAPIVHSNLQPTPDSNQSRLPLIILGVAGGLLLAAIATVVITRRRLRN